MATPFRRKVRILPLVWPLLAAAGVAVPAQPLGDRPATLAVLPLRGAFNVPRPVSYPGQEAPPMAARAPQGLAGAKGLLALEDQINQRVTMAFFRTGRFQLIERAQLTAVLKEGRFEQSGLVDDATAAKLGQQMGATYVLVGSYTGGIGHSVEVKKGFFGGRSRTDTFPGHLEVRLRLVDTEDGAIRAAILLHASSLDSQYDHSYELLMDDLSRSLDQDAAERFPMTGYVVKVLSGREALVDLGRKEGLEKGDRFNLVERGADVVHPVTGKLIEGERRVLTEMQVTDVGEESSVLKVTGASVPLRTGLTVVRSR